MSNFTLTKISALSGASNDFDGVRISEIVGQSLVMLAIPNNKTKEIAEALKSSCSLSIPDMCQSSRSEDGMTLWRLQKNQLMVYFSYAKDDAESYLRNRFNAPAYYTDQSDTWAMISINGKECRKVLERICPLDLDPNIFTVGSVSRTIMEHIGTIIYRESEDSYSLLVMRSFAVSMMHALTVSANNVL